MNILARPISQVAVLIIILSALLASAKLGLGLTNDTNTLLHYAARMVYQGGLYDLWMEVNPPMIMMLYALPASVIAGTGLPAGFVLHGLGWLLCAGSLVVLDRSLAAHQIERTARVMWVAASAFILFVLPLSYDCFADREHLLFVFSLPWIIQMLLGVRPGRISIVMAAVGFCIKPYNMLICFALLLFGCPAGQSIQARVMSRSTITIGLVGAAYLAAAFAFFPGYIFTVVPQAMVVYEGLYIPFTMRLWPFLAPSAAMAVFLFAAQFRDTGHRAAWAAFAAICILVYLLNGGWTYTHYLLGVPLALLAARTLIECSRPENDKKALFKWILMVTLATFVGSILFIRCATIFTRDVYFTVTIGEQHKRHRIPASASEYLFYNPDDPMEGNRKLRDVAGDRFVLLSTTLWGANLSRIRKDALHIYPYDYLYPLPWLVMHEDDPRFAAIFAQIEQPLIDALKDENPPSLIVDESDRHRKLPGGMDILGFFRSHSPGVEAAMKDYRMIEKIDYCDEKFVAICRFSVWRKTGGVGADGR